MKLLVETSVVFFGTLLAAALMALGAPGHAELEMAHAAPAYETVLASLFAD
jgi:hypothetical protein